MGDHGSANVLENKEILQDGKENLILLGNPNVGKSVIFGLLTGKYVVVSNYPGTTVEISRGIVRQGQIPILDTPGINSVLPQSEDEKVTRDILLDKEIGNVLQVIDAKNLSRGLLITLQLIEAGLPLVLTLNMNDEAKSRGISINTGKLAAVLGVPVHSTVAVRREGIKEVLGSIKGKALGNFKVAFHAPIEEALEEITPLLPETNLTRRFLGLMLLAGDSSLAPFLSKNLGPDVLEKIDAVVARTAARFSRPLSYEITKTWLAAVDQLVEQVWKKEERSESAVSRFFNYVTMHPVWGIPVVLVVMYLTYKVVGELGAGLCVDFLENVFFGEWVNPLMTKLFSFIPVPLIQELFVGEYGIITMALTYGIAIVLPVVGFFFFIFGILEDSGYLPRLAIMVNKIFKVMGLNGKAVLPMILGLGCDTMATMTARILPSKKERVIVTLLLALAVPCSAQLGIIFGATAAISGTATIIWLVVILLVIFGVGFGSSKLIPGQTSDFILEIPPLRVPELGNIMVKTMARLVWYLKEAVPFFVLGTLILFISDKTGFLVVLENWAAPVVVNFLHLPKEAATAFIMGFLRRDYAAVLIARSGALDPIQMLVAIVTITLFVPCVANFFIMIKERGLKTALLITTFIFVFAFSFGGLFNWIIRLSGIQL